jgi:hypothetical protein
MLLIEQEEKGLPGGATMLPEGATIKFYLVKMVDISYAEKGEYHKQFLI